jgi:hypothetical protein
MSTSGAARQAAAGNVADRSEAVDPDRLDPRIDRTPNAK